MSMRWIFIISIFTFLLTINTIQTAVPTFFNINVPIQVREDVTSETVLDSFNVIDPDGNDVTSCTHSGDSGEFDIRQDVSNNTLFDLYVLAGANIEYDVSPSFVLVVSCIDSQSETGTVNIQVDVIPNQPPTVIPAISPISISENIDLQTLLYTVNMSDAENDPVICDVNSTDPTSNIFDMWWDSSYLEFNLYLLSNAGLSHSTTPIYTVTLECSDNFGSSTSDVVVFIIPNSAPAITNLPGNLYLDASATSMSTTVFTATATDNDSTSLTYSMTSYPAIPDLFSIDTVSGEIKTQKHLEFAVDNAYKLSVTVSDSKSITTAELKIFLSNVNIAPTIDNLPYTVYKDEDIGSTSVIFSLDINDPDPGDSVTLTFTVWPAEYASKFYIHQNKHIRLQSNERLNYEEHNYIRIEFMATDSKTTNGPFTLTIYVNDVTEKCSFDLSTYYVTMIEGNAGSSTVDPGFSVTDEDLGDTYSFSIDYAATSDSSYFSIDGTSGLITFATAYDVDASHSTNVTLIAVCTDSAGLIGTATVSVTVEDVNDNAPQFSKTGYISYIDQNDTPTTTVKNMNMVSRDKDSGLNGEITYSWTQITAGSSSFFHMNANGQILLLIYPASSMTYGDVFTFSITGKDRGTPSLSSTTTLDIIYRESNQSSNISIPTTTVTTNTTETTTTSTSFWDKPANITVVVLSAIIGALLAGIALYLGLKKYKTFTKWKKGRANVTQRKVKPVEPKPNEEKETFDFWNDRK